MRTVAIISRKGGAGKTNIAVHLAACAEGKGMRAGIVDLDPQATSTKWGHLTVCSKVHGKAYARTACHSAGF